jgi:hypothetical protein
LISPVSECAKPPSYQPRPDGRERWRYGGLKTRSKLLIPRNPLVAHALMRAVFALLRTPVATEPKRSQERRAIPAGNVFGGRKLAFPPPWRSVFPRNRLFRFAFAVHPCLRELSGECERGTQDCVRHVNSGRASLSISGAQRRGRCSTLAWRWSRGRRRRGRAYRRRLAAGRLPDRHRRSVCRRACDSYRHQ